MMYEKTKDTKNNGCKSCSHIKIDWVHEQPMCYYFTTLKERDPITGEFLTKSYTCKKQNKNLDCRFYEPRPDDVPMARTKFTAPGGDISPTFAMIIIILLALLIGWYYAP